jgi:hypothetical protein
MGELRDLAHLTSRAEHRQTDLKQPRALRAAVHLTYFLRVMPASRNFFFGSVGVVARVR